MEKKNEGFARLDPPRPVVGEGETKSDPRAPKSHPRAPKSDPGATKMLDFPWFLQVRAKIHFFRKINL